MSEVEINANDGTAGAPATRPFTDLVETPRRMAEVRRTEQKMAAAEASKPKPRPSIMAAIARVFRNPAAEAAEDRVAEGRKTYVKLLRVVAVDGRALSDREAEQLQDAMRAAGISAAEASRDEKDIRLAREGREAQREQAANSAKIIDLERRYADAVAELAAVNAEKDDVLARASYLSHVASQGFIVSGRVAALIGEF